MHEGVYLNDKLEGAGVLTYPNGDRYAAEWINNELKSYKIMLGDSGKDFQNGSVSTQTPLKD